MNSDVTVTDYNTIASSESVLFTALGIRLYQLLGNFIRNSLFL